MLTNTFASLRAFGNSAGMRPPTYSDHMGRPVCWRQDGIVEFRPPAAQSFASARKVFPGVRPTPSKDLLERRNRPSAPVRMRESPISKRRAPRDTRPCNPPGEVFTPGTRQPGLLKWYARLPHSAPRRDSPARTDQQPLIANGRQKSGYTRSRSSTLRSADLHRSPAQRDCMRTLLSNSRSTLLPSVQWQCGTETNCCRRVNRL